jgi:hypothetical protein
VYSLLSKEPKVCSVSVAHVSVVGFARARCVLATDQELPVSLEIRWSPVLNELCSCVSLPGISTSLCKKRSAAAMARAL